MSNFGEPMHRVSVVFKPEGDEKFSTEEQISFSSKEAAIEFRDRQTNRESVLSARYISMEAHKS